MISGQKKNSNGNLINKKNTPLDETTFVVCDTETTGLSAFYCRITEISLIKVKDGEILDKYTTLINPGQHIPSGITRLTGISDEDVFNKPSFSDIASDVLKFLEYDGKKFNTVFTAHNAGFDFSFIRESFRRIPKPLEFNPPSLCTCKLARRILTKMKSRSLANVAEHFGIKQKTRHRAYDDSLTTAKILIEFLDILNYEYGVESAEELLRFQNKKIYSEEKKPPALKRINLRLKDIPEEPGVYYMKSRSGEIIYIGKAKNLRERVSSYFRHNENLTYKIRVMLSRINSLEWEVTDSELSALILESKMIKTHKPRFNTAIKRFRFHPFLKLDVHNDFPKLQTVYEIENDGAYYYGPFSSKGTVRMIYKDVYDKFRLRKCEDKKITASEKNSNCMYYDIGKCDAPCNRTVSREYYNNTVNSVHQFITGLNSGSAIENLKKRMSEMSINLEYEKAALYRDRIKDIDKVLSYQKVITSAINNKKIVIKCDNGTKREIFFVHNGKLLKTITLNKDTEHNQTNYAVEIEEITESLYFSLNKFVKHKYSQFELDEIKVISNWLALNRDKNKFLEINDNHKKEDLIRFIFN